MGGKQIAPMGGLLAASLGGKGVPDHGLDVVICEADSEFIENAEVQLGLNIAAHRLAANGPKVGTGRNAAEDTQCCHKHHDCRYPTQIHQCSPPWLSGFALVGLPLMEA